MGARQLTLAGDVVGLRGARLLSGVVPGDGRTGRRAVRRAACCGRGWAAPGAGSVIRWSSRSGGLRGGDGDDAAGVEFAELPHQVVLPGIGGFAAGVEVGAQVGVWLAGLQDAVGDLEQGVRDRGDRPLLRALVPRAAELADQAAEPGLQPARVPGPRPGRPG